MSQDSFIFEEGERYQRNELNERLALESERHMVEQIADCLGLEVERR